jgi:predicted nucleic acid-binding protein
MKVYLDTNVFVALVESADAALQEAIWGLFSSSEHMNLDLVTSELSLAELLVKPFELGSDALASAYLDILQPVKRLYVVPVTREVLLAAAQIRSVEKSIRLPDGIHLATADHQSCNVFLTADRALAQKRPSVCRLLSIEGVKAVIEDCR